MQTKHQFPLLHRILHWTIALGIVWMLLTVFLRSGWMNAGSISRTIMDDLSSKNIALPKNDVTAMAKHITSPMWSWHLYVGYALSGIFALRVLYILRKGTKFGNPFSKKLTSMRERTQVAVYFLFYLSLGVTLLSGLLMKFGPRDSNRLFKEVHEPSLYFMVAFLAVHLMGIFMGEHGDEKGVVSAMIGGGAAATGTAKEESEENGGQTGQERDKRQKTD